MKHGIGRRLLSIVLSVMMLVSLLPTTAFAEVQTNNGEPIVYNSVDESGTVAELTNEDSNDAVENGNTTTYVAKIGENTYETLDAAITAAEDGAVIVVNAGEYKLNGSLTYSGKAFTIKAADGAQVSFDMSAAVALHGAKITFEGVTFDYKTNGDYIGLQHTDTLVYKDCTINGMVTLYATSETFNNCTFNAVKADGKAQYSVWTYGANTVTFNECTFNCDGKAVNAYQEGGNTGGIAQTIVVKDCNVKSSAANKAFLNIKNTQRAYDVVLEGTNTVEGLETDKTTNSNLYQVETTKVTATSGNPVTVKEKAADGTVKTVYEVKAEPAGVAKIGNKGYETLKAAIDAATTGDTITLLQDVDLGSAKQVLYPISDTTVHNLTFDLNGHKITSAVQNNGTVVAAREGLVIKNGTIENTSTGTKDATSAVYVTSRGTTTLENVTLRSKFSGLYVCQLSIAATVVVNVEKGTVIEGGKYGVKLDTPTGANSKVPDVTLNINGGTITGTTETGVYAKSASSSKTGTINVNIKAGTVKGVTVVAQNNTKNPVRLDITGGTVNDQLKAIGSDNVITISGGTFANEVSADYLTDGFELVKNEDGTYGVKAAAAKVAQIGTVTYATLDAALAYLTELKQDGLDLTDASLYALTLSDESVWDTATPVYWAAGEQSGFVATLTDALTAAYKADAGKITIVCRPGADVGTMTHGHVADNITIFGNKAYVSGGECDLEVDTNKYSRTTGAQDTTNGSYLDGDISIIAFRLDNLGVWGQRNTTHTVNVALVDCDSVNGIDVQRVYISGTSGRNEIGVIGCDFKTANTAVYSNADGVVAVYNCTFEGSKAPVNVNHKADDEMIVTVMGCTFTNCGDTGMWKQFAAPVRFVNSGSGTMSTTVDNTAFTGTVSSNGDILLGDGRNGEKSNDVTLTVTNTSANIQAQKPGYYNGTATDATKMAEKEVKSSETYPTISLNEMLPAELTNYATVELTFGGNVSAEDIAAAKAMYEGKQYETCKAANEAYMALFGVTWEKGYLDVTDTNAPLYKYAGVSGSVAEVKYYIHGTMAGFTPLKSSGNQIDCTVGGNHQIFRTSVSIIGVNDANGNKAKLTDGNVQAYVAGGYESMFTASGKLTIDNIEFTTTTSTTVGASAATATDGSSKKATGEMEIKNCKFNGRLYVYDNFDNTGMTYNIHDNVFDGTNYSGDGNAYAIFAQCKGGNKLTIEKNTISGFARGINIDHANVTATIKDNTISITDSGRSCIQLSSLTKAEITGNTLNLTGGNAVTLHEKLLTMTSAPEISFTSNTVTGTGYLVYDDAVANSKSFTADNLKLTVSDNTVDSAVDTKQGVKGNTKYGLSEMVNAVINGVVGDGTEANPYTLEQLSTMTRAEYIAAQKRLDGTMYVTVGNYAYDTNGVLGNGVRNDATGQTPDHSKLNAYGENGYLGEKNDSANGKNIVFVSGSITSGVTGYKDVDNIGTSLLLALPAYTNVTFKDITFNNVMSFDYQLYTVPWSQLGELKFDGCTFNGLIVGAIAAQTLTFNGCEFTDYTNKAKDSDNNSNPTWIRPAYGNWTKGDNEGQGDNFRSLTTINFTNNKVTSTRPVKFERIAQWEMATTVTATGNSFDIKGDGSNKNVGMYFGANAKFNLVAADNTKSEGTAALYTAVYSAPDGKNYAGLPAGSTVTDGNGKVILEDAKEWKSTTKLTLESTTEVASMTDAKGNTVNFATLQEAVTAAGTGATVKLIKNESTTATITVAAGKDFTLDLNGKTVTSSAKGITVAAGAKLTVKDSGENGKITATGSYSDGIENKGTLTIESGSFEAKYGAVRALGGSTTTINGGTFSSSENHYGMYYWADKTALTVTVNGGTFKHSVSTAMESGKVTLKVNGGSFTNDLSAYCLDGYATNYDEASKLYVYGELKVPDGYVEDASGNVTISDEDGLFWFAKQVNEKGNTFAGKTVTLANDITLTKTWTPVGVSVKKSFQGTFDGAGHTISGMDVNDGYRGYGYGFFKLLISATVKNVTFDKASVKCPYANIVGIVSGYSYGSSTFENVHVTASTVHAFGKVGGMVGMAEDGGATTTFRNCDVSNTTIQGTYNMAGFLGLVMGKCSITGSYLKNNTVAFDDGSAYAFGTVTNLDTTVTCDGSVSTCAGNGTHIKGKYIPDGDYYYSAYSDLYNHYGNSSHDCTLANGKYLANSEVVNDAPVEINGVKYSDLQTAFDAAQTGDTVTLLTDITLTEQVNITKALDGLTLDGNGKTITCATATDPLNGKSALYFGNANSKLYCTGIKIKDLTMTGTARFAIFLCGGTSTEFTNVNISGNYYIAVNLYGTHGATMTNCNISNSTTGTDKYISGVWSNVASQNPLKLVNSKVDVIAINTYTTANKLEPKIFIDKDSSAEIHTFDDGSVSGNKKLCVSTESTGTYTIKEYDETTSTWVEVKDYVAEVGGEKYDTLPAAIEAAKSGETVKLLTDITIEGNRGLEAEVATNVTLDLNGHKIDGTSVSLNTTAPAALTLTVGYDRKTWLGSVKITSSQPDGAIIGQLPLQIDASGYADAIRVEIDDSVALTVLEGGKNAVLLNNSPIYLVATDTTKAFYKNGGFMVTVDGEERIYESLGGAKNGNKYVTLMNDYTTTSTLKIWENWGAVTLDLGGHTYMSTTSESNMIELQDNAKVTFKNGTLKAEKAATVIGSPSDNTTLTLDGMTVDAGGDYGIATNGSNTGINITLTNSTIKALNGVGVYFPSTGSLTIDGGSIEANTGVQMCAGNLTIKGGSITASGDGKAVIGSDGSILDGAAISIINRNYPGGTPKATITGGTFKSADGVDAMQAYVVSNGAKSDWDEANVTKYVNVSGGTFSTEVLDAWCADGYHPVTNANGTYGVKQAGSNVVAKIGNVEYTDLFTALLAAKKDDTVLLVADVVANPEEDVLWVKANVTLDLNGYSVTNAALLITNGQIKDTATAKGYVSAENYTIYSGNAYTPVYDSTHMGYSFFDLGTSLDYKWKPDLNKAVFALKKTDERAAAKALMAAAPADGRRVKAAVTFYWEEQGTVVHHSFVFSDAKLLTYLTKTPEQQLYITVKGLDQFKNVEVQTTFEICRADGSVMFTLAGTRESIN